MKTKRTFSERLIGWLGLEARADAATETEVLGTASLPSKSIRLPAAIRDRYQPLRVLGHGSFGIVYLARDRKIGRLIAVKQLHHGDRDPEIYERFLREARIAGQIGNPNIITIYDVVEDRRSACIIMEYQAGGNLDRLLRLDGAFGERAALHCFRGILDGLAAAHRMGVVHRDIKPPNILFDQSGNPVVSDFGVAHLPLETGDIEVEDALRVVGTPEYMAPEQMSFEGIVDARSDLYSAGLLLYEMLAGRRLFTFDHSIGIEEIARLATKTEAWERATLPEDVSAATSDLVRRLIRRHPNDRYPDAGAALLAVEAALTGLRTTAKVRDARQATAEAGESGVDMFEDTIRLFLVDGVISPPERRELERRASRLGVLPHAARELEEKVRRDLGLPPLVNLLEFEALAEQLLSDGEFSAGDHDRLAESAKRLDISAEEQRKIQDRVLVKFHLAREA